VVPVCYVAVYVTADRKLISHDERDNAAGAAPSRAASPIQSLTET